MKNREIWNTKHARVWEEFKNLVDDSSSKEVHTSEIVARCVKSETNPHGFISLVHLMKHLINHPENSLVKEGRIELARRGLWRMRSVMHKDLLPKEFLMSLLGLEKLPKRLIKSLKMTGDYSYRSETEKEIGGGLIFAPLMGEHKSGIINDDFLFGDPYWLREIFTRGVREGMIDEQDFRSLHELPVNERFACLGKLWNHLFGNCECFTSVFWFNPQKLLMFLQTKEEGKQLLKSLLTEDVRSKILKEALFKMPKGYAFRTREVPSYTKHRIENIKSVLKRK